MVSRGPRIMIQDCTSVRGDAVSGTIRRSTVVGLLGVLVVGFALLWTTASQGASDRPAAFMNRVAKQLVAASRTGSPYALAQVIRVHGDVRDIGLYSLGAYRRRLPAARRDSYYDGVARFMARYFIAQSRTYRIARIQVFSPSRRADWGYKVDSRVTLKDGSAYRVRWLVVRRGRGFKVRDVSVLGFWLTPFQRDLFESYIRKNGGRISALLSALGG